MLVSLIFNNTVPSIIIKTIGVFLRVQHMDMASVWTIQWVARGKGNFVSMLLRLKISQLTIALMVASLCRNIVIGGGRIIGSA